MELDELKQAWQTLGQRLERQEAIQFELLKERKLANVRGSLRPLLWGQAMQILLGIGLLVLGIACWSRNTDIPTLFATGIGVHAFGVLNIIMAGMTMGLIASIDYSAPVLAIQKQSARLLRFYLLNGNLCGLSWWVMWLPITMAFAGLGRINLAQVAPSYVWSSIAISMLGLAGTWWYLRRKTRTAAHPQPMAGGGCSIGDGADGIRRSQRQLEELARFERE